MYLTYEEYDSMGGTLDETTFNDYETQAEAKIDWYTFNRLRDEETYSDRVKQCVFQLIKLLKLQGDASTVGGDDGGSSAIASQSNDGVSISYNVLSASQVIELGDKQVSNAIKMYLNGEKDSKGRLVLYRGLYEGE